MSASLRLRLFERNCAAVDASFADVQDELAKSVRSFEAKTHQIRAIQNRRGKSWREMMNREEQLNEYADSIIQRLRIIQHGRERIARQVKSMNMHFQSEWQENQRQLELLQEQELALEDTRHLLSDDNIRLYQSIIENETQASALCERQSLSEISIHSGLASRLDETIDSFEVEMELQRTELYSLDKQITKVKRKISKLDAVRRKQKQEVSDIKLTIEKWKKRVKSGSAKFQQIESKFKNKMDQLNDHSYSYSQQHKDASLRSSSIQSRNDFTISEIRSSERHLSATKRRIAVENQKTEHLEASLASVKEQSEGIAKSMIELKEEKTRQTETAAKSKEKMKTLQYEHQKVKCDVTRTARDLEKEQINVQKVQAQIAVGEEAVKEAMRIYDRIEMLEEQEQELNERLKAVLETNKQVILVENDSAIVQMREHSITRETEETESVRSENAEAERVKARMSQIENEMENMKQEQAELEQQLQEAGKISSDLWKGSTKPSVKAVKDYINKREADRAKKLKSKNKVVETLEARGREGVKRIDLLKKKTAQQKQMLKESESIASVSKKNDLGYHSVQSFQRSILDEASAWKTICENEVETILKRWDQHISGLFEEIDDYFLS